MTPEGLFESHPEYSLLEVGYAAAEATPEGGESVLDARERVLDAWTRLLADVDDAETVAVVAHGGPVRMIVAHLLGMDVLEALQDLEVRNCSVTEVTVDDGPELVRTCETVSAVGEVEADAD
jgi:probable phosphoglycerate mutase